MTDMNNTTYFEFNQNQNKALSELSRSLYNLGIIILIGGVLFVVYLVLSFLDPVALLAVSDTKNMVLATADYALWLAIALLVIYLSIMVVQLAKPIRLIAKTTGADINHLMKFIKDLTSLSRVSFWGILVICLLILISLVLLILVF